MTTPLIPPDPTQCQSEITTYNAFVMGGNPYQVKRCENKPTVIATEKQPGPDGQVGAMSLCAECQGQMDKQMPDMCSYAPVG